MALTTINDGKERAEGCRPVVLATFTFADASVLRCSTHNGDSAAGGYAYGGHDYAPLIADEAIDRLQALSELGIDRCPSVTVKLADPKGELFQSLERGAGKGFKGAAAVLLLVLHDPETGTYSSDDIVPFFGGCDAANHVGDSLVVTANSRLGFGRYKLPSVPIQCNCPKLNPATAAERAAAANPGSRFYPCGETRDVGVAPPCQYTKATCTQPARFLGVTFNVKNTDAGREFRSGQKVAWRNADTSAKYKEFWPLWLGGTCWLDAGMLTQQGDANYTRGEVAVGFGKVQVLRVIVNGEELVQGTSGDYRWHYVNQGAREGTPNGDAGYDGLGDPYGSATVIQILTLKEVWDPGQAPSVQILGRPAGVSAAVSIASASASGGEITIQFGRLMGTYDPGDGAQVTLTGCGLEAANGTWTLRYPGPPYDHAVLEGSSASGTGSGGTLWYESNTMSAAGGAPTPWLIAAVLRACGRSDAELNAEEFAAVADVCRNAGFVSAMVLREQRTGAELLRGLRQSIAGLISQGEDGRIGLRMEGPLAEQQPAPVDGSNYDTPIASMLRDGTAANGYAAYLFNESYSWDVKPQKQKTAEMPNRVSFPFVDPENEYVTGTCTRIDSDDVERVDQELPGGLQVTPEGVATRAFADACAKLGLAKIHRGNAQQDVSGTEWWTWVSSFRGCRVQVGDLVALTNAKYGLTLQLVRVTEVAPSKNYETVAFKGHTHFDAWYLGAGVIPEGSEGATLPNTITVPGDVQAFSGTAFGVTQEDLADGSKKITVEYDPPDPLGPFTGVACVIERADGSREYLSTAQYDVALAGAHGTASWIVASPGEAEDWYIALVSCSATARNTFYAHGAAAPSPYRVVRITPVAGPGGAVAPAQPSLVVLSEVGPRVAMPMGRTATTLRATLTGGGASADRAEVRMCAAGLELYGQTIDGPVYPLGAGYVDFPVYVHTSDATWTVRVSLASPTAANAWSTAVESAAVVIAGIGAAANTNGTGCSAIGPDYVKDADGVWRFSFRIQGTNVATDPNWWTTKITAQWGAMVGGVWTPAAGEANPASLAAGLEYDKPGAYSDLWGGWYVPNPSDTGRTTLRLQTWARSRGGDDTNAWVLQATAWSGTDHLDLTPTVQAAALDATRLDPAKLGASLRVGATGLAVNTSDLSNKLYNPRFDSDLTGWLLSGAVTWLGTDGHTVNGCAKVPAGGLVNQLQACKPGDQVYLEAWVKSSGADGACQIWLTWLDSAEGFISSTTATQAVVGVWTKVSVTGTAPANAAYFNAIPCYASGATAGFWLVDDALLRPVLPGTQMQLGAGLYAAASGAATVKTAGTVETDVNGNVVVKQGTLTQPHFVAGALADPTGSAWSSAGAPVIVYYGLPTYTIYALGQLLFCTADSKLYRRGATGWEKSTAPGDLIAGTFAAGVIYAGSIMASQITAGTMTAFTFVGCTIRLASNGIVTRVKNADANNNAVAFETWEGTGTDPATGERTVTITPYSITTGFTGPVVNGYGLIRLTTQQLSDNRYYGMIRFKNAAPDLTTDNYTLWVDATGKLRILSGSAYPTNPGDGTVVGTQS